MSEDNETAKPANQNAPEAVAAAPTPEQRAAALETEKNEAKDRMLRIAAEFENYKKRARKDAAELEVKVTERLLRDFLEVLDNLERAAASPNADVKAVQQGVNLVARLFQSKLERYDVKPFETKGQPFDPRLHDAISQVPTADAPPGSVVSEVQRGYRIGERLLRPAMVSVAVAVAPPSPEGERTNGSGAATADDKS
jgi:molecular chaperone GrpE